METILICDCSQEVGDKYHMVIDNIKELLQQNINLKIIPTHFIDKTKEKLELMNLEKVFIIDDGYEFELED